MPRLSIEAEPEVLTLVAEALRGEALRRRRAAERFSGELQADKRAGRVKDIRTGAQHVVALLAEADELEAVVHQLDAGGAPEPQPGSPAAAVTPAPANGSAPEPEGPLAGMDERGHRLGFREDPDVAAAAGYLAGAPVPSSFEEDEDEAAVAATLLAAEEVPPVPVPGVPVLPEIPPPAG